MSGIFISYRRASSSAVTYRLVDELKERFGEDSLFFDAESIDPGVPFDQAIQTALSKCTIALIVIGPTWISIADDEGKRRLDNAEDWVRREVNAAMHSHARVIPVLVEGASVPTAHDLPANIQELSGLQAFTFAKSPEYWDFDVDRLEKSLRKVDKSLPNPNPKPKLDDPKPVTKPGFSKKVMIGIPLGVVVVVVVSQFFSSDTAVFDETPPFDQTVYTSTPDSVDEPPADIPPPQDDSAPVNDEEQYVQDSPDAPPEQVVDYQVPAIDPVPPIVGVWRGAEGAMYQFQQAGEQFQFAEFNVYGVQVGAASGYFEEGVFHFSYFNNLLNATMQGQMMLDINSGFLYGSLTNFVTGQQLAFQLQR
jgi:hypothetical protein